MSPITQKSEGPQQEQELGRKEEDYQGRKGGIDVSSPSGTSLWRERTRKSPALLPDLELSCSPRLRAMTWNVPFEEAHATWILQCMTIRASAGNNKNRAKRSKHKRRIEMLHKTNGIL